MIKHAKGKILDRTVHLKEKRDITQARWQASVEGIRTRFNVPPLSFILGIPISLRKKNIDWHLHCLA